jgi:DNA-binding NarL/FixJ family response regulator
MSPRALTPQQSRVARYVALGWTDKQISAEIGKSRARVRQLIGQIAAKLNLDRSRNLRTQIAQRLAA